MAYYSNTCPKHHCKLAETAMGRKWCPKCEGERMGKEVSSKLKLNLNLDKKEVQMKSAICPVCKQEVVCTHPMQTIGAQMRYHLRDHGLKGKELLTKIREAGL